MTASNELLPASITILFECSLPRSYTRIWFGGQFRPTKLYVPLCPGMLPAHAIVRKIVSKAWRLVQRPRIASQSTGRYHAAPLSGSPEEDL